MTQPVRMAYGRSQMALNDLVADMDPAIAKVIGVGTVTADNCRRTLIGKKVQ